MKEKWQSKYLTIIVKPRQGNQPQSGCSKLPKKYKEKGLEVPPHLEPDYNEGWK